MVFSLSKWISSNPEGHFALKIHFICPETQFSQTLGRAVAPPDPLGNTPMLEMGPHICNFTIFITLKMFVAYGHPHTKFSEEYPLPTTGVGE